MLGRPSAGALCILLLAVAACGDRGGQDEDVSQQSAETPVEAFFRYGPVALGATRASLRKALGEPDSMRAQPVPNRHDPSATDSVVTMDYPGLRAEFYRVSYDGKELLTALSIADDRYLRPESPLRIGMEATEVRLALGEPSSTAGGVLAYTCTSCNAAGYDVLELQLARGLLQRIALRYWID